MKKNTLISIIGPTAVGKTALSLKLAQEHNTHIISCDSRQFYRYMDVGTAKASKEEQNLAPHHFIDFLNPDENCNAGQFAQLVEDKLTELFQTKDTVIMVGGSTLYANAVWYGIDEMPEIAPEIREQLNQDFAEKGLSFLLAELQNADPITFETIDRNNHVRVIRALEVYRTSGKPISFFRNQQKESPFQHIKMGLTDDRDKLYERIDKRVLQMIDMGLMKEVSNLLSMGYTSEMAAMRAIGYAEMIEFLEGKISLDKAISLIQQHSRNYAKRQLTYFRRDKTIEWQ